jgi:hypothetical protein
MRMVKMIVAVGVLLLWVPSAWGAVFWDCADGPPGPQWEFTDSGGYSVFDSDWAYNSLNPAGESGPGVCLIDLTPSAASRELDCAQGWFVEMSVNVIANVKCPSCNWTEYYGASMIADDGARCVALYLHPGGVDVLTGADGTAAGIVGTCLYDSPGFHTVGFLAIGDSMRGLLFIDGVQRLDIAMRAGQHATPQLILGDPSSNSAGIASWGYVGVNVPEPAAISLLVMGGLAMVRRRRQ